MREKIGQAKHLGFEVVKCKAASLKTLPVRPTEPDSMASNSAANYMGHALPRCLNRFGNFTCCSLSDFIAPEMFGECLGTQSASPSCGLVENSFLLMFSMLIKWSGRGDLNSRPLAPQASALPGYATPRTIKSIEYLKDSKNLI
jgi:hypothetical protein